MRCQVAVVHLYCTISIRVLLVVTMTIIHEFLSPLILHRYFQLYSETCMYHFTVEIFMTQ